jgi:uroporphyrinogen-III synthase
MNKPLQGRRIVVTRPAAQAAALAQMIAAQGGEPICFALLEIAPANDPQPLQQAIARLDDYAMAIFISPNAVMFSVAHILAQRRWPEALQAVAIGPGTAAQLAACGIGEVIVPARRFDSEALLEMPQLQRAAMLGKKVLILRGNGGREELAATLQERGAQVDAIGCYRRLPPGDASAIVSLLRNNGLDALTISSSEGLRNLLPLLDTGSLARLQGKPVFVAHQRIAETAVELGWQEVVVTGPADAGVIEGLCAYNWRHHE